MEVYFSLILGLFRESQGKEKRERSIFAKMNHFLPFIFLLKFFSFPPRNCVNNFVWKKHLKSSQVSFLSGNFPYYSLFPSLKIRRIIILQIIIHFFVIFYSSLFPSPLFLLSPLLPSFLPKETGDPSEGLRGVVELSHNKRHAWVLSDTTHVTFCDIGIKYGGRGEEEGRGKMVARKRGEERFCSPVVCVRSCPKKLKRQMVSGLFYDQKPPHTHTHTQTYFSSFFLFFSPLFCITNLFFFSSLLLYL